MNPPVKFNDTVSSFIKEAMPLQSGLYCWGLLHTNLLSVIPTVTFSALESPTKSAARNNVATDGNAIASDTRAAILS